MAPDETERITELLQSPSESDRLKAARDAAELDQLSPDVDRAIRESFARESVPWVKGALADLIAATDGADWAAGVEVAAPVWSVALEGLDPELRRQLINVSTDRVLHDVASVVGRARVAARKDLGETYAGTETARELEFLSEVCAGLRTVGAATQAPEVKEFDLAEELTRLGGTLQNHHIFPIRCNGPAPFPVRSDRGLVRLAVENIVVNAIEATLSIGSADLERAVVLTWGASPSGFHVTVIDRGPGPPRFLTAIQNAGISTKEGHPGYGLASASEALQSVGGSVLLRRNDRGGATVVLSWKESG